MVKMGVIMLVIYEWWTWTRVLELGVSNMLIMQNPGMKTRLDACIFSEYTYVLLLSMCILVAAHT